MKTIRFGQMDCGQKIDQKPIQSPPNQSGDRLFMLGGGGGRRG